jgi:signal transduction histidine kinase
MIDQVIPPAKENLESLMEEVGRLTSLIDGLQEIALSDKAIYNFEIKALELSSFLSETAQRFEPLFKAKNLVLQCSADEPGVIETDREALAKVLDNLLSNAMKYTPSGKEVRLALSIVGNAAFIDVSDQGTGISAVDLPYVFERFYRTDHSRNRESGGFGLGLTIAKELTEALGGTISVVSKLGEGSTFTLKLPLLN